MLRGAYKYGNDTWTLFAPTHVNGWAETESAEDYLIKMNFAIGDLYKRSEDFLILNQLLKVSLHQSTQQVPTNGFECCIYISLRDYPDRGMMALVEEINELVMLLGILQPVVSIPLSRTTQIVAPDPPPPIP